MRLLDDGSQLQLVRLEGPNPEDAEDGDDRFLACDLIEYYGGSTFVDANRIVLSQLKYSVKHSNLAWTAARMTQRRGSKNQKVSVAKRLAEMFVGVVDEIGQNGLAKVTIALVSNQNADSKLVDAIAAAQEFLSTKNYGYPWARLAAGIDGRHHDGLVRLRNATGLGSGKFTDFLRVLDFSGCGATSRRLQRLTLANEISDVFVGDNVAAGHGLMELMRLQMLPETAGDPGLTKADVIVALGASGTRALFPYPSRVKMPDVRVPTSQSRQLARAVIDTERPVLAHGGPGIGKTTVIAGLEDEMPFGSVLTVYDCYAGGEYLSPSEDRHSVRALVQIANDIALRLGLLPLVIPDSLPDPGMVWRRFQQVVDLAGRALPSGAFLVIAIDAADNSVEAANRIALRSFIDDLWRIRIPDNVRLLMTCRTARRADVVPQVADTAVEQVPITAFDLAASSRLLRLSFPYATDEQCSAFHERSQGVARVQVYAMSTAQSSSNDVAPVNHAVDQAGRGLPSIFDDVLATALNAVRGQIERRRQISVLATMSRPANPTTIAAILEVEEGRLTEIIEDLWPALQMGQDGVDFADEDFENHLRTCTSDDERRSAHSAFADYFSERQGFDDEAVRLLGEHLFNAGRVDELITIAVDMSATAAIEDGLLRAQTYRARVGLALRAAIGIGGMGRTHLDGQQHVVRLIIAAADAARTDSSLLEAVASNPGLAALHASPAAITALLLRDDTGSWRGRLHMQAAALLAATDNMSGAAAEQIELARAWLKMWSRSPRDNRQQFGAKDIAHLALASALVEDVDRASRLVLGWRPRQFVEDITYELFNLAPRALPLSVLRSGLDACRSSTWVQVRAVIAYAEAGVSVPRPWVQRLAARLDQMSPRRAIPTSWGMGFFELALSSGVPKTRIRRLSERLAIQMPSYVSDWDALRTLKEPLRVVSFRAALERRVATADDLLAQLPPLTEGASYEDKQRRQEQHSVIKSTADRLLPVLWARARCLAAMRSRSDAVIAEALSQTHDAITDGLKILGRNTNAVSWHIDHGWVSSATDAVIAALHLVDITASASVATESTVQACGVSWAELIRLLDTIANTAGERMNDRASGVWLAMARSLTTHGVAKDEALDLLDRFATNVETAAITATERRDALMSASAAAQRVDPGFAGDLFNRAAHAAAGVDSDIGIRLRTVIDLAAGASSAVGEPLDDTQRYDLACAVAWAVEDATPFVDDAAEHLPHRGALRVATELHGPSGLATACRWYHEDRINLPEALTAVIPALVGSGTLSSRQAFWLLRLCMPARRYYTLIQNFIDASIQHGAAGRELAANQLATLTEWALRDTPPQTRLSDIRRLISTAEEADLGDLACITRLRDTAHRLDHLQEPEHWQRSEYVNERYLSNGPSDEKVAREDLAARVEQATLQTLESDLAQLAEVWASRDLIVRYISTAIRGAAPHERHHALETVFKMTDRGLPGADAVNVAIAVREPLHEWAANNRVETWAAQRLPTWIRDHLTGLFTYGTDPEDGNTIVMELPTVTLSPSIVEAIVHATASHLDVLMAPKLHAIARSLTVTLRNRRSYADAVRWALDNGPHHSLPPAARLRHEQTHQRRAELPAPPSESNRLLAAMMWSLLGQEDLHMRWRTVHTLRPLLEQDAGGTLATQLWTLASAADDSGYPADPSRAFRALTTEFFSHSARQWLLITFTRVAHHKPANLVALGGALADKALDRAMPHAAIRELARSAALAISRACPGAVDRGVIDQLTFANQPDRCSVIHEHVNRNGPDWSKTRFYFSYTDTFPYWFRPLSEVFHGVSVQEVATLADQWVTDRWGRTDRDVRNYNDDRPDRDPRSWHLTRNDHGKIPRIEVLDLYLSLHAMQCVAGELIDASTPLSVEFHRHENDFGPWEDWLSDFLPHSPQLWLADMRTSPPVHKLTVGAWHLLQDGTDERQLDIETRSRPDIDPMSLAPHACKALQSLNEASEMRVVAASTTTERGRWSCNASMMSALVTPVASRSLLAALASSKFTIDLPTFDDGFHPYGDESDIPGLRLIGWLRSHQRLGDGLDRYDPYAGGGNFSGKIPFPEFLTHARLTGNSMNMCFTTSDNTVGAHLHYWADGDADDSDTDHSQGSQGWCLSVRRDLLIKYLQDSDLSLVASLHASAYHKRDRYDIDDDESNRFHYASRFHVLKADGTEVSVDGTTRE